MHDYCIFCNCIGHTIAICWNKKTNDTKHVEHVKPDLNKPKYQVVKNNNNKHTTSVKTTQLVIPPKEKINEATTTKALVDDVVNNNGSPKTNSFTWRIPVLNLRTTLKMMMRSSLVLTLLMWPNYTIKRILIINYPTASLHNPFINIFRRNECQKYNRVAIEVYLFKKEKGKRQWNSK